MALFGTGIGVAAVWMMSGGVKLFFSSGWSQSAITEEDKVHLSHSLLTGMYNLHRSKIAAIFSLSFFSHRAFLPYFCYSVSFTDLCCYYLLISFPLISSMRISLVLLIPFSFRYTNKISLLSLFCRSPIIKASFKIKQLWQGDGYNV